MPQSDDDSYEQLERTAHLGDRIRARPAGGPRLIVVDGASRGKVVDLGATDVVIGRRDDCGLMLDSPAVSKRHALVRRNSFGCEIEDLRSTNGVRVNGRPVPVDCKIALCHGDLVEISDHRLLFLDERDALSPDCLGGGLDRAKIVADADALIRSLKD